MMRSGAAAARAGRATRALALALTLGAFAAPAGADPSFDVSSALADDADVVAGRNAAERNEWDTASKRLSQALARYPESADLHNDLGHAYRNLRKLDLAFDHYHRAIALDPRHRGAHEYIGEAYLMVGDLPNAEKHLVALRAICLLRCEELDDLEKAVASYRAGKGLAAGDASPGR
jgi:tetratricopeptide (TPR) repeat protein